MAETDKKLCMIDRIFNNPSNDPNLTHVSRAQHYSTSNVCLSNGMRQTHGHYKPIIENVSY